MYCYTIYFIGVRDYNERIRAITIPAGASSRAFSIPIVNDNTVECTETFNITMQAISIQGVSNIRASIIDDDSEYTYSTVLCTYVFIVLCLHTYFTIYHLKHSDGDCYVLHLHMRKCNT